MDKIEQSSSKIKYGQYKDMVYSVGNQPILTNSGVS